MTRSALIALLLLAAVEVRCQQQICLNNCGTSTKAYQACIYNSANAEVVRPKDADFSRACDQLKTSANKSPCHGGSNTTIVCEGSEHETCYGTPDGKGGVISFCHSDEGQARTCMDGTCVITFDIPPKPEPLDVPAIQDSRELSLSCREAILNQPLLPSENLHCVCTNTKESCTVLKWDCDDKTRFLLPSADGKYHCLKLVPEVKP